MPSDAERRNPDDDDHRPLRSVALDIGGCVPGRGRTSNPGDAADTPPPHRHVPILAGSTSLAMTNTVHTRAADTSPAPACATETTTVAHHNGARIIGESTPTIEKGRLQ